MVDRCRDGELEAGAFQRYQPFTRVSLDGRDEPVKEDPATSGFDELEREINHAHEETATAGARAREAEKRAAGLRALLDALPRKVSAEANEALRELVRESRTYRRAARAGAGWGD